jgi:cation:H+ antiporter
MSITTVPFFVLILIFLIGLVLIVKGGDAFVDAASWIAEVSGIPQFIIGATIVSLATTLPEMLVSCFAASAGSVDMAVGNAVGSVTANTGLILAIALMCMPGPAARSAYLVKSLLLIGTVSTLLIFSRGGRLSPVGSILLVALFVVFLIENVHSAKTGRAAASDVEKPATDKKTIARNVLMFVLGAAGIVAGAQLLVNSAKEIATRLNVPEIVIAVTIVAVGTSLPELVTTITAIAKKQASLSAGNVIGANIIDTALILPICSAISGQALPINAQSLSLDIPVCLAVVLIALVPTLITQKFRRWQGVAMLAVYLGYLALVVL